MLHNYIHICPLFVYYSFFLHLIVTNLQSQIHIQVFNPTLHQTHSIILLLLHYISIIISVTISCYSSSLPTHIRHVTLSSCTGDFTCRFLCLDVAREVTIDGGTRRQSRDSERLCDVTEHR